MNSSVSAKFAPSWRLALTLSLLLHGSVLLPCLFLVSAAGGGGMARTPEIDTIAPAPVTEIRLLPSAPRRASFAAASSLNGQRMADQPEAPAKGARNTEAQSASASAASPATVEKEPEPIAVGTLASRGRQPTEETVPLWGVTPPARQGLGASSGGPGTGPCTTVFFEIATQAKTIVYVVDRSASMGLNGCLAAAKRELRASLDQLPSSARFQIIVYNRSAAMLRINGHSGLVSATSDNKRCVASLLEEIPAEGGTEHLQAVRQALALRPDVIYFLTDAADLRAEQIRAITALNHGRCVIHTIELGRAPGGSSDSPLAALARENQGCYKCLGGALASGAASARR
jgi:hypothetical protein